MLSFWKKEVINMQLDKNGIEKEITERSVDSISKKLVLFKLKTILKIHSSSYRLVSPLAKKLEADGLHPKHRIMNYHQFFVDNVNENDTVLDIGCGNGALTYDVAKKAKKVVGIDLNDRNILIAKRNFSSGNIEYICGEALTDLPNEKFDVIILSNVLEHIDKRVEFLRSAKNLASKFLIRVPMLNRSWIDVYKKELGLEYRLDKTHFVEYTFESFKEELDKAGLKVLDYSIQFGEIWGVVKIGNNRTSKN
jgi:2-polyprenyl-3-methyl-5-hydroxy-6-metoxy-1,4-benzoquinol methylase